MDTTSKRFFSVSAMTVLLQASAVVVPVHAQVSSAETTFFVTSAGPGNGGDLGGLDGADRHCQMLAAAAGAGGRTWRAYLSTSEPAVAARDRIGSGPWTNAAGQRIADDLVDLHAGTSRMGQQTALDENGRVIPGIGDEPNLHDILTGSLEDGTPAVGMNCQNWTSSSEGAAMAGHHDRLGGGGVVRSWNSVHATRGCSLEDFAATGGAGAFYCFAID